MIFSEYKIGERHRHKHAQLVDGCHHACRTFLERPVIAHPGGAGGNAGAADEQKLLPPDLLYLALLPGHQHHDPRHDEHRDAYAFRRYPAPHTFSMIFRFLASSSIPSVCSL